MERSPARDLSILRDRDHHELRRSRSAPLPRSISRQRSERYDLDLGRPSRTAPAARPGFDAGMGVAAQGRAPGQLGSSAAAPAPVANRAAGVMRMSIDVVAV